MTLTPEQAMELRKPFPKSQIGKIPASQGRPALDFVGHAAVTDRLNGHADGWTYTVDEVSTVNGACWIRGTMTIGGVSRVEFGDGKDPKEAIGNFIRRAAMRWGVAIDLWSREELDYQTSGGGATKPAERAVPQGPSAVGSPPGPSSDPAGKGLGEGPEPAASGPIVDVVDLWERAANHFGSTAKTVLYIKRKHPTWEIRSEADVLGWHLVELLAEAAVA